MSGVLLVIESGSDAAGKATQSRRLVEALQKAGYPVMAVTFPNYESPASAPIKMYLGGAFGDSPDAVNPYVASTFYAVDRFASYVTGWKAFLDSGGIVVADRYTTSNMVHQASKIQEPAAVEAYLEWLEDLEYTKMGLPRPDGVLYLNVPFEISMKLLTERGFQKDPTGQKDIHEADLAYLERCHACALQVARRQEWCEIDCTDLKGGLATIDTIHERIMVEVDRMLQQGCEINCNNTGFLRQEK